MPTKAYRIQADSRNINGLTPLYHKQLLSNLYPIHVQPRCSHVLRATERARIRRRPRFVPVAAPAPVG